MDTQSKLLAKLKEQEAAIKEKIKQAQKKEAKRQATLHAKKCEIIGTAILAELGYNQAFKSTIDPIIHKYTTNPKQRKILGLAPLVKSSNDST